MEEVSFLKISLSTYYYPIPSADLFYPVSGIMMLGLSILNKLVNPFII